jgi:hypothetical protein
MPSITVPDTTGDVKLSWNPENPDEVKNARDHYETLKKSNHIFFKVGADGSKGKKVREFDGALGDLVCEFDPKADVVAAPMVSGG